MGCLLLILALLVVWTVAAIAFAFIELVGILALAVGVFAGLVVLFAEACYWWENRKSR